MLQRLLQDELEHVFVLLLHPFLPNPGQAGLGYVVREVVQALLLEQHQVQEALLVGLQSVVRLAQLLVRPEFDHQRTQGAEEVLSPGLRKAFDWLHDSQVLLQFWDRNKRRFNLGELVQELELTVVFKTDDIFGSLFFIV